MTHGEPTWRSLVNALRKEGQEGTARDIEEDEKELEQIQLREDIVFEQVATQQHELKGQPSLVPITSWSLQGMYNNNIIYAQN